MNNVRERGTPEPIVCGCTDRVTGPDSALRVTLGV